MPGSTRPSTSAGDRARPWLTGSGGLGGAFGAVASGVSAAGVVATAMVVGLRLADGAMPVAGGTVASAAGFGVGVAGLTAVGSGASIVAGTDVTRDGSVGDGPPVQPAIISPVNKAAVTARPKVNCSPPSLSIRRDPWRPPALALKSGSECSSG